MELFEEFKQQQCGEIYLLTSGTMTFHCTLCEEKYNGFDDFAGHVLLTHKQNDYTMIKEEDLEDEEVNPEIGSFSVTMDSCDGIESNDGDESIDAMANISIDDEKPTITYAETNFQEGLETPFEIAMVDEDVKTFTIDPVQDQPSKVTKKVTVKKEGNAKKIVPRRPRTVDDNSKKKSHVCTECDYSTNLKVKLVEHIRRHFNDRPFSCDYCDQRFYMQNEKTRHTARQHPETVESKKPSPEKIELKARIKSALLSLGGEKFQCKECNFICEGRASMWYHIRRHSSYKPYQCTICAKTFYTSNELNTHIRSHTGEKPFLCTECGSAFSTSSKLSTHLKRHNNIRDKECSICQRRFFNKRQLESHMAVHSDERPFECQICSSKFKRKKTLSSHMKIHAIERAFQCEICDAAFSQQTGLIMHNRAKHTLANKVQATLSDN